MTDKTAEIIPFPTRAKPVSGIRNAVEQLHSHELIFAAGALVNLAIDGYAISTDVEFYELIDAAHLALGRLLVERGWI